MSLLWVVIIAVSASGLATNAAKATPTLESVVAPTRALDETRQGDDKTPPPNHEASPSEATAEKPGLLTAPAEAPPDSAGKSDPPQAAGPDAAPRKVNTVMLPADLVRYVTGDPRDAQVRAKGPGLLLMGGGRDVDEAFRWWRTQVGGGDVVVLRTTGADGYNDYLFREIGGFDSVETLMVTSRALANCDYVFEKVRRAEGVFLAGGDQARYVRFWGGTRLVAAVHEAWRRGAVLGGTSAGCAVLGERIFSAERGTIRSPQALAAPYHERATIRTALFPESALSDVLLDTHFTERDRFGRLAVFLARVLEDEQRQHFHGLGIDPRTALVIGRDRIGTVLGEGGVHLLRGRGRPTRCATNAPLQFSLSYHTFTSGTQFPANNLRNISLDRHAHFPAKIEDSAKEEPAPR